ncbi:MAG TPA: transglutaminase family protein [Acidimicrobiales bacterium]|nr:transglutaminase family protein [Acidimicrobiales bacterium]
MGSVTWRIQITHHSGYRYQGEVNSSYNEARITPLSTDRQVVLDASVTVAPAATVFRYWDYWGTLVDAFEVHQPHTELAVTGSSVVETSEPQRHPERVGWDVLAGRAVVDEYAEYLTPTRFTPVDEELADAARHLVARHDPLDACQAAVEWARSRLRYEAGTTDASSSGLQALHHGVGVCQDFAHVTLALLRAMGIPGRYVSGYLHPDRSAPVGGTVTGQSHAWVDAWVGDWMPLDPTNGDAVGERHVVVGRARDYADVSPLQGIYHGGPAEALVVNVELTRQA